MNWLVKSEPAVFSIYDLKKKKKEPWDGVRNYQARNYLKSMQPGELVFFYHSNTDIPGIYGICKVASEPYPDPTQFNPQSKYCDPKSDPENPRWWLVDMAFHAAFKTPLSLQALKEDPNCAELPLVRKGTRLSVMPVPESIFKYLESLGHLQK